MASLMDSGPAAGLPPRHRPVPYGASGTPSGMESGHCWNLGPPRHRPPWKSRNVGTPLTMVPNIPKPSPPFLSYLHADLVEVPSLCLHLAPPPLLLPSSGVGSMGG